MFPHNTIELVAYEPQMFDSMVQAYVESVSSDVNGMSLSYAEARSLLTADVSKPGFDARLVYDGEDVAGFIAWYSVSPYQLASYIRTRFASDEEIELPENNGAFICKYSIIPTRRETGLARTLAAAAAEAVDAHYEWSAMAVPRAMHSKAAAYGFVDTGLCGHYDPDLCLMMRVG